MLMTHRGSGIWLLFCWSVAAILFVTVPATIMTSASRGEARKKLPSRSWSYRGIETCIISTPQQARPKVRGQRDPCLTQLTMASSEVLERITGVSTPAIFTINWYLLKSGFSYTYSTYSTAFEGLGSIDETAIPAPVGSWEQSFVASTADDRSVLT